MAAVRSLVHYAAAAAGWIAEADEEQILKRLHARPVTGRREGQRMPLADVQRCLRLHAQAPLKQIQFLLGHDKLDTTARYVNDEQKFGGEAVSKVADIS